MLPRPYFRLQSGGATTETAERILPLEGGRNFRDLGGYTAADGRMVRWGVLYRSGEMAALTEADYRYLSSLGIVAVCDLRSSSERTAEPTRWPGPRAPTYYARDYVIDPAPLRAVLASPQPTVEAMRGAMIQIYAGFPFDFAESYAKIFADLIEGSMPLAFNCSAGKDRSGVMAALVLTALGVSKGQILADYDLSNQYVAFDHPRAAGGHLTPSEERLSHLPPEVRAALMRAEPAYLQSAFDAIVTRDGSVPNYLQRRLGVGPREIATLRRRLLKQA